MSISWRFAEANPNVMERDPIQEEFFSNSNTLTDLSSLIRESIQNSLDAHDANLPNVVVRFSINEVDLARVSEDFFGSLGKHLEASLTQTHHLPSEGKCKYLLVEDFNTTGLLGSVSASAAEAEKARDKNSYRYFRWQNGSSSKSEGKRGKWGIGKVVFPKVSAIKTFFAYSVRKTENGNLDEILFGQSLLKFHSIGETRKQPDGWWGTVDENQIDIPVGTEWIPKFKESWSVGRRSGETGLSILVPFVDPTFTTEEIRNCILRDYFIAIADGTLTVEVTDANGVSTLSKETMPTLLDELEQTGTNKFLHQAARIYYEHTQDPLELIEIGDGVNNSWTAVSLEDSVKAELRQRIEDGEAVGFKVNTLVTGTVSSPATAVESFTVILTKQQRVKEKPIICREGILIPNASPNYLFDILAIVNVESGKLADLLGDAEGPAHENWSANRDRFKDKYTPKNKSADILVWVRNSARELSRLLKSVDDGQDDYFFGSLFPMPSDGQKGETDGAPKRDPKQGPKQPKPKPIPPANPIDLNISKSSAGFKISKGEKPCIGKTYKIQVAYETRRGNAFTKWIVEDFNLNERKKSEVGAILNIVNNEIHLQVNDENFSVLFDGFDKNRDLIFSANEVSK